MLLIKKILCPTDFSEASLPALQLACEMAQSFNAELLVLNIVPLTPPIPPDMMVFVSTSFYPTDQERCNEAREQVEKLMKLHVPSHVQAFAKVEMGQAADEIVCSADNAGADLIVMGTHGRTGWRHLAFGSVTEAVVRMSHCPVLTVPVSEHLRATHENEITEQKSPETAPV